MVVRQEHEVFFKQAQKELQDFYKNSQLEYFPSAEHRAHAEFDAKSHGRPIKKHIDQAFRIKTGSLKGKEYLYYYETHTGTDHRGNRISKFLVNGKYDKPIGLYQYDELRGENVCIGIDSFETTYQYPFETKSLDELVDSGEIDGTTRFILSTQTGRLYSVPDFDSFRNMPSDELEQYIRTGERPQKEQQERKQKQ